MLCIDTTMLREFENENKKQNKKNLRLKIYGKIRNGRLKPGAELRGGEGGGV